MPTIFDHTTLTPKQKSSIKDRVNLLSTKYLNGLQVVKLNYRNMKAVLSDDSERTFRVENGAKTPGTFRVGIGGQWGMTEAPTAPKTTIKKGQQTGKSTTIAKTAGIIG